MLLILIFLGYIDHFLAFLGFIFLILPLLSVIYIAYLANSDKNKFIFFPYFVSICLINSSLLIYVIIKLNDSCRMFGILTLSYERIYNLYYGFYFF